MQIEMVETATADGLALVGGFLPPDRTAGVASDTAFLMMHGNGGNFYHPFQRDFAERLAAKGYAVLVANNRGHDVLSQAFDPWGRAPPEGPGSVYLGTALERIEDCRPDWDAWIGHLSTWGFDNVVLWGHSRGAVKTAYYLAAGRDDRVGRAVLSSPPWFAYARWLASGRSAEFISPTCRSPTATTCTAGCAATYSTGSWSGSMPSSPIPNRRWPLVVGIGGTTRQRSSSERLLRTALRLCEDQGARTCLFDGPFLAALYHYAPERDERTSEASQLVAAVRAANGLVIASPGYHGGISGLVKNALDYLEDLRDDARPYLTGRPVGCLGAADGWQGANGALAALRTTVHALRGWPTPLGLAVNTQAQRIPEAGVADEPQLAAQLREIAVSLVTFAHSSGRGQAA